MQKRWWQILAALAVVVSSGLVLGAPARPVITPLEDKPDPVTVKEEQATHKMLVADYRGEDTLYPESAPREQMNALKKQIQARVAELDATYQQQHPKVVEEARRAQAMWDKLPAEERQTEVAKQLYALIDAVKQAMIANRENDQTLQELMKSFEDLKDSPFQTIDHQFPLITLSNGLVEVKVVPTLAMRILNAVDLRTGRSLAGTEDPRYYEKEPFRDVIGWTAGYIEASYPYFEHGTGVRQPAGYRIIRHADGAVTVAMNMWFTEHQHPRHTARYGRYNQRALSSWLTLRPGESGYSLTYRLDNPNPLQRGDRLWVNILMEAERYDDRHILYPAGYVVPHGGQKVWAFQAEGGTLTWENVSHFALFTDYDFRGVYSPTHDFNSLIITDDRSPGMKLYTRRAEGGFLEHWTGHGIVFEDAGGFVGGYEPVEFTTYHFGVGDAGRVVYADEHVAVSYADGNFVITAPRSTPVSVSAGWDGGRVGVEGVASPKRSVILKAPFECELTIRSRGAVLSKVKFPLVYTDTRDRLDEVKDLGGELRIEKEQICNHVGAPTSAQAIGLAKKLLKAESIDDKPYALSIARTAYRYGHLDAASQILAKVGGGAEADYLRGLIAWERGEPVDFGEAGAEANYHRAMLALQVNSEKKVRDFAAAIRYLNDMISQRPAVYRPRLMRAYLMKDMVTARRLSNENPASPEALLVLELLGDEKAAGAKAQMLKHNPGAAEAVEAFRGELTEGKWQHVKRFEPLLPKNGD